MDKSLLPKTIETFAASKSFDNKHTLGIEYFDLANHPNLMLAIYQVKHENVVRISLTDTEYGIDLQTTEAADEANAVLAAKAIIASIPA